VIALLGLPCGQVVSVKRLGDNDHIASCQDGNRYRVYLNPRPGRRAETIRGLQKPRATIVLKTCVFGEGLVWKEKMLLNTPISP